jgi:acylphosphatase
LLCLLRINWAPPAPFRREQVGPKGLKWGSCVPCSSVLLFRTCSFLACVVPSPTVRYNSSVLCGIGSQFLFMKVARKYVISGRVQGVGFRYFAEHRANQLGILGYVRNCWDGTVEVYAVGDLISLEEFKNFLAQGPRSALVTNITESEEPVDKRCTTFVIEDGW